MSTRCRRAAILNYFGEALGVQCTGCDVCDDAASTGAETHDFTADFRVVLELVEANRKNLTVNQIVAVLRGAKEGQKHCSGVGFGSGSGRSNKWWENVCNVMISSQLLKMEAMSYVAQGRSVSYTVVCSTPAATAFIRDSQRSPAPLPIALVPLPPSLRTRPLARPSAASTAGDEANVDSMSPQEQELLAALNAKRKELADAENPPIPVTGIALDSVLRKISIYKPSTLHQVRFLFAVSSSFTPPPTARSPACFLPSPWDFRAKAAKVRAALVRHRAAVLRSRGVQSSGAAPAPVHGRGAERIELLGI